MLGGHRNDQIGLFCHVPGQAAGGVPGDVQAVFGERLHRLRCRARPLPARQSARLDTDAIDAPLLQLEPKEGLGHGGTTDVSGAHQEDRGHPEASLPTGLGGGARGLYPRSALSERVIASMVTTPPRIKLGRSPERSTTVEAHPDGRDAPGAISR